MQSKTNSPPVVLHQSVFSDTWIGRIRIFDRTLAERIPNPSVLVRYAIIAGVLAASFGLSLLSVVQEDKLLLMAAVVASLMAVGFFLRMGKVELGVLALIPIATLMNFYSLPTGTQSRIVLSLLVGLGLVGLWLVQVIFLRKGQPRLVASPVNAPLLLFVIASLLSFPWGIAMRDPLVTVQSSFVVVQIAALLVIVLLPLLALLVANEIKEISWLKRMTWVLIGIGAWIIFCVLLNIPLDSMFNSGYRGLFATWVCALALAMALFHRGLRAWQRGGLVAIAGAWFYYDFFLHNIWFSGWVPIGVACLVLVFLRSKKVFAGVMLAIALLAAANTGWIYENLYQAKINNGDAERLGLWQNNLDIILAHPLLGVGPAGYAVYYMTYHPQDARSTHNNYFDIVAQTGVIGFGFFIWMIAAFLWVGIKVVRLTHREGSFEEGFAAACVAGMAGLLVAMLLGDWVLPFAYNQTITGFDNDHEKQG